ncbi:hypothetical protein GCM10008927_08230 [Amylibacter ulvae]|uniref:Permease n=1 Tax=Paramylibacter ulvae TaxID=1651968 RepID=A0ABQ3CWT7_9RHOB|nr:permease [Amylibacter ulvae]GHA45600.1 hypothetical protein GCM10008927_08230 [Amylibacter ulvae]
MAEHIHSHAPKSGIFNRIDGAWVAFFAILGALAIFAPVDLIPSIKSMLGNLSSTAPFILFAVFLIAFLRATGAEAIVGKAFQGNPVRMVILAAMVGGLAPFCSCEVIPFIAALLAMGTPLAAVMAFWLASPIMDPPMFVITSSALGIDFAIAKTIAGVGMGMFGGFVVMAMSKTALFADPLRNSYKSSCGCGGSDPFNGEVTWAFWTDSARLKTFRDTAIENAAFLFKWLALAYLVEAVMIRFVPAEWIAELLGGEGLQPILLGTLLGAPAYLNGYAAVPLISGLLEQGMSQGAAMSFMIAGSVSCIPAAIAVWALVKPKVFVAYVTFGFIGAFSAGTVWAALNTFS